MTWGVMISCSGFPTAILNSKGGKAWTHYVEYACIDWSGKRLLMRPASGCLARRYKAMLQLFAAREVISWAQFKADYSADIAAASDVFGGEAGAQRLADLQVTQPTFISCLTPSWCSACSVRRTVQMRMPAMDVLPWLLVLTVRYPSCNPQRIAIGEYQKPGRMAVCRALNQVGIAGERHARACACNRADSCSCPCSC